MKKYIKLSSLILGIGILFLAVSCEKTNENSNKTEKIKITTTTTMLKDLLQTIGGDKVEVINLMGEGVNPHLYNTSAGDIEKLNSAVLIVFGGLHLEGKIADTEKNVLGVGDYLDKSLIVFQNENTPDPHVWFDTKLWSSEAEIIANKLSETDEENRVYYMENLRKYQLELDELTVYIEGRISVIPESKRVLVTAHDAFGYFARQFKLEVKSIQGISTDSEAGTKDISELADFI